MNLRDDRLAVMTDTHSTVQSGSSRDAGTVYVVDDDEGLRQSLQRLLQENGIGCETFAAADAFLGHPVIRRPSCLLLDIRLPGLSGIDLQKEMIRRNIDIPIIFITGYATVSVVIETLQAGAAAFLEKPFDTRELLRYVQEALALDSDHRNAKRARRDAMTKLESLSPREREVLQYVIEGYTSRDIARTINRSERTVELHRAHIMRKFEVNHVTDLLRIVIPVTITASNSHIVMPEKKKDLKMT